MKIFIPTRGRSDRQITGDSLVSAGLDVTYVVNHDDKPYPDGETMIVNAPRIGPKRQAIVDGYDGPMIMLDDDLRFKVRLDKENSRTRRCEPEDLRRLFAEIERDLADYDLIGVADQYRINDHPWPSYTWKNQRSIFAFDTRWVKEKGIRFDRCHVAEDTDVTMQVLGAGGRQKVKTDYIQGDVGRRGPGGCSTWRTNEIHNEGIHQICDLWPGIASLLPRRVEGRVRMMVRWKKLRERTEGAAS